MNTVVNTSVKSLNTFNIDAKSLAVVYLENEQDLYQLSLVKGQPFYILGEGSNTLFIEDKLPILIKPDFKGITITEDKEHFYVEAASGENWHNFVEMLVNKRINGLENLALIPGSVGAAPVQNIGAYGVELADYCLAVDWFDLASKQLRKINKEACCFGYRDSIFKNKLKNKGIITKVYFRFAKDWQANISYSGLDTLDKSATALDIFNKVIEIRQHKLPDPKILPNAGSFFKNPIISKKLLSDIQSEHAQVPSYPVDEYKVKVAAGWLIDKCGLKGYQQGDVGIHKNQALVLINYGNAKGKDVVALCDFVKQQVLNKFNIALEPEVRFVSSLGEV